jgi:serine/threonine protein phosphatase PrpC
LYTDGIIKLSKDYGIFFDNEINFYADLLKRGVRIDKPMAIHMGSFAKRQGLEDNATALSLDLRALNPDDQLLLAVFDGHGDDGATYANAAVAGAGASIKQDGTYTYYLFTSTGTIQF